MADPRIVTATVTVGFGVTAGADSLLAEVDGRTGGLNKGKTNFRPGDDVYMLVYKSANVSIVDFVASHGSLAYDSGNSPQVIAIDDILVFANEREASVSKPVSGAWTRTWLGGSLGNMALDADQITFALTIDPSTVVKPYYAGVALLGYNTQADVYKLTNTMIANQDEYQILCVFVGEAT